jgi:DNA-binding cell septation regulator SpoVG
MDERKIFRQIEQEISIETKLSPDYRVTGIRKSRGQSALFYSIPNKKTQKRSQKSIVESEFAKAHRHLLDEGELTIAWFKDNLPITASQSTSCSFKVIGEVFVLLGLAQRKRCGRGHKYIAMTE